MTRSPFKMPTESPRDLKWQIRTVTCRVFCQNSRRTHRRIIPSVKPLEKVNICPLCRPSPPLFLLLLPNPNSPHLQTTRPPPPPKQKSPSSQHNKLYFLKFCGHNIRVLIYQRILSIFISNSIFLKFNI